MEIYKQAVQTFVDQAMLKIETLSNTPRDLQIRYLLFDVMDVLYAQGVLDESPLNEYSDGLGPMGQDLLYWNALEERCGYAVVERGERLVSHIKSHTLTTKDFAVYEQLLFHLEFHKLAPDIADASLTFCRAYSQYTCNAILSPNLRAPKTSEEGDIRIALSGMHTNTSYPIANAVFRVQQLIYRVLTKISDLNYLSDVMWWYNTRLYLSCMSYKYQAIAGSDDIFAPLLSSLTIGRHNGS